MEKSALNVKLFDSIKEYTTTLLYTKEERDRTEVAGSNPARSGSIQHNDIILYCTSKNRTVKEEISHQEKKTDIVK